jgi:hypothetical protein
MNRSHTKFRFDILFCACAIAFMLCGCTSNMSEDDKFLWYGGTNAPASNPR